MLWTNLAWKVQFEFLVSQMCDHMGIYVVDLSLIQWFSGLPSLVVLSSIFFSFLSKCIKCPFSKLLPLSDSFHSSLVAVWFQSVLYFLSLKESESRKPFKMAKINQEILTIYTYFTIAIHVKACLLMYVSQFC